MLHVVASERIEPLVADLAALLRSRPLDPMTPEWIAVGSDGLQRWLQLELAKHLGASAGHHDGVAANITFAYPGTLRTAVLLAGTDQPEYDPWLVDQLVWSVAETLAEHADDPVLAPLVDTSRRSRYRRARQIAERFAAYQLHRPKMLLAWWEGRDVDAALRPIDPHQAWQPHLWRLVRARVGVPSPAERLTAALERVRNDEVRLEFRGRELPPRLVFFGPSLLPTGEGFLEIAEAVSVHRDVFVHVIEPSEALSTALRAERFRDTIGQPRSADVSADAAHHPLLRSWGRLQRETALLLGSVTTDVRTVRDEPRPPTTLLATIQQQIRANVEPIPVAVSPDDASIRLHACFGRTRQVEAARDAILGLLADPELEMREDDIVVVCPQLEAFTPVIEAVFGPTATPARTHDDNGTPLLRYRITGRSGGRTNPMLDALDAALAVASGRFEVDRVAELLAMPAVRTRFGWTEDDVDTLRAWAQDTNVKWGLSPRHRAAFGLPETLHGYSWRDAVEQLLLGTAVLAPEDGWAIGGIPPSDRGADHPELAGQLAVALGTLERLARDLTVDRTIEEWAMLISRFVDDFVAPDPDQPWQLESIERLLHRAVEVARLRRAETTLDDTGRPVPSALPLTFRDVRQLLTDLLAESRTRSDFFRGGVTVTSLSALRNIPYRAVLLLGADQAAFSAGVVEHDDLIATNPRVGDRDRRAEVRQTLLDALLAAGDRFEAFYDGVDVRTNTPIPPAVVLAELLDTIDATLAPGTRPRVLVEHRRQPFDELYFRDDSPVPRSFSRDAFAAALARRERGATTSELGLANVRLRNPIAGAESRTLTIDKLVRSLEKTTRTFLDDGLGVSLPRDVEPLDPTLPVASDNLQTWKFGTGLLQRSIEGGSVDRWIDTQMRRGALPASALGRAERESMTREIDRFMNLAEVHGILRDEPEVYPIDLELDGGRRIVGAVQLALGNGRRGTAHLQYSRQKPKHRLRPWVELLCLTATDDSAPWHSVVITRSASWRDRDPAAAMVMTTKDLDAEGARRQLEFLARFYDEAIRRPIPFVPDLAYKLLNDTHAPKDWRDDFFGYDADLEFVWGDVQLDDMLELAADDHPLIEERAAAGAVRAYAEEIWGRIRDTLEDSETEL